MISLTDAVGEDNRNGLVGDVRLSQAYREVFTGKPTPEDQQIVLADLAASTGFYRVSVPPFDALTLAHNEGKRTAYAEVFKHLSLSHADMAALERAARVEAEMTARRRG